MRWFHWTHWGRVTHICVSKLTIIGSDNGLSPDRRQAIIWTNAGLLLIGPLGTNFSEILIEILTFSFKKMRLKVSSAKRRLFCLGLNELIDPNRHWSEGMDDWLHHIYFCVYGSLSMSLCCDVCCHTCISNNILTTCGLMQNGIVFGNCEDDY